MSRSFNLAPSTRRSCAALGMFLLLACSDDGESRTSSPVQSDRPRGGSGEASSAKDPLYAVMYEVFNGESSDSYLSLFDSLDLKEIDTAGAREFSGGRAFLRSFNDWIFVGEPGSPIVRKFTVGDDDQLVEEGQISFANYGLTEASIDEWTLNFVTPTKAYLFDAVEGSTIIWNPKSMAIEGEIDAPQGYVRDGYDTSTSPAIMRGSRLYRSMFWEHPEEATRSEEQVLIVYDVERDEIVSQTEEKRCPAPGNRAFEGEDGTLYFSNWIWAISQTLLYDAPENCVLRILPDEDRFDPEWSLPFSELADGREGAMFTYVGEGKGVMSIFHHEDVEYDAETDPYDLASNPVWELWNVDIEARSGAPLQGVPRNTGAYTPVTLDERVFLMVPGTDWDNTQLYEIEGDRATARVNIPGWSYMFVKVRD